MPEDYYRALGVDTQVNEDDLQQAFNELRKKWHPDRFQAKSPDVQADARAKLDYILKAHDILSNPRRRAAYDHERAARKAVEGRGNERRGEGAEGPRANQYQPRQERHAAGREGNEQENEQKLKLALTRLRLADSLEAAQAIIEEFNNSVVAPGDRNRVSLDSEAELLIGDQDYDVICTRDQKKQGMQLSLLKLKMYKPGEVVQVKRSNGAVESGWKVASVYLSETPGGPVRKVWVTKPAGGGEFYEKNIPISNLRRVNGGNY